MTDSSFWCRYPTRSGSISSHSPAECGVSFPTKQLQMPSSPNDFTSVGEPYLVLIDVRNKTVSFAWITESRSNSPSVRRERNTSALSRETL